MNSIYPSEKAPCGMLALIADRYRVEIVDVTIYSKGSVDNVDVYDHVYRLDEHQSEYAVTSRHVVRVTDDNNKLIATCLLLADGGASSVHDRSATVINRSCVVAVGSFVASLAIPDLRLQWATQTDAATCFGIFYSEKHHCLISHGEMEVARLSLDGQVVWRSGGADVFTNGIKVLDDLIHVVDFNEAPYSFEIATGRSICT